MLTAAQVRNQVTKGFPDLGPGTREAMAQAFLLFLPYLVDHETRIAALEGGVNLTDADGNPLNTETENGRLLLGVRAQGIESLLEAILLQLVELNERQGNG